MSPVVRVTVACVALFAAASIEVAAQDVSKATVYVYRKEKAFGYALEPSVFLDGQRVAAMDNGRYFALVLEPGSHIVQSNEKESKIEQTFEAGKVYFAKINIVTGFAKGHGHIALVSEEQGRKDMARLKPLDAKNVEPSARDCVSLEPASR